MMGMRHGFHGVSRLCFAVILVLLFLGVSVAASPGAVIKIGMKDEPKTLNPFRASDSWSRKVVTRFYEPLYTREPKTHKIIPWLAEGYPEYDEATNTAIVRIKRAKWEDGSPLTAHDVVFTGSVIREFKVPRYHYAWRFIKELKALDDYRVKFVLEKPMAIFMPRTLMTFFVQKRKWEPVVAEARKAEKPLKYLLAHEVTQPVSCGAFKFVKWARGAYIRIERNENFFATGMEIGGRKVGPYVDGILFKFYGSEDSAMLALKKGDIDYYWSGIQAGYVKDLEGDRRIKVFKNDKSGVYYLAFNVRKPPFSDRAFRQAVAYLIDKDFIVIRVLQKEGQRMDSIIPPGNRYWHNPDTPKFGQGMKRKNRVKKAYEILKEAEYTWERAPVDGKGKVCKGEGLRMPDGRKAPSFDILTPPADYDPHRAMAGMLIQQWLRQVGIPASSKPSSFGSITQQVKVKRQFDAFILGWGNLAIDPDYLRTFFHSKEDRPYGRNPMGYHNGWYDTIADESAATMDEAKRQELILKMQKFIIEEAPYIPLYVPYEVEACRVDRFTGWNEDLNGVGNHWSLLFIEPTR
jgi:peptide/nickel transport system substrate-binding protein